MSWRQALQERREIQPVLVEVEAGLACCKERVLVGGLGESEAGLISLTPVEGRRIHVQVLCRLDAGWVVRIAAIRAVAVDPQQTAPVPTSSMRRVHLATKILALGEDLGGGDETGNSHLEVLAVYRCCVGV